MWWRGRRERGCACAGGFVLGSGVRGERWLSAGEIRAQGLGL